MGSRMAREEQRMNLHDFVRQAKVGDSVTVSRLNRSTSQIHTIEGTLSGWDVSCQPVELSSMSYHQYVPGNTTVVITLMPWNVDLELMPADDVRLMEPR